LRWQTLRYTLVAAACVVYLALGYVAAAWEHPPLLSTIVALAPMLAAVVAVAWNSRARVAMVSLCVAALIALALDFELLREHVAWIYFIQHAGTMAALGVMFGRTLRNAESALCSRIACSVLASPPDAVYLGYTWKVTLAWTVYFFASAVLSTLLFFLGPLDLWSLFAVVLTPVLIGAMFVGEYLVRLRALPDRPHFSVRDTIQAYRDYSRR
jgi:uncharacterized membrane protein